jgi:hypothetical protein
LHLKSRTRSSVSSIWIFFLKSAPTRPWHSSHLAVTGVGGVTGDAVQCKPSNLEVYGHMVGQQSKASKEKPLSERVRPNGHTESPRPIARAVVASYKAPFLSNSRPGPASVCRLPTRVGSVGDRAARGCMPRSIGSIARLVCFLNLGTTYVRRVDNV